MEVAMMPAAAMEFNFDSSSCSSPYITAPSSPQRFGTFPFSSAPASPTRISAFYRHLNDHPRSSSITTAMNRDQQPDHAHHHQEAEEEYEDEGEDFEFNFSGPLVARASFSAADELFDGGKIRPLTAPSTAVSSPRPSRADSDDDGVRHHRQVQERGRERVPDYSCSSRNGTRSLSPVRVSDEQEDNTEAAARVVINSTRIDGNNPKSYASAILSAISFSNKKWKLKDLLFRSASEGRATSPDPIRKYAVLSKKESSVSSTDDVLKFSSFRSVDGGSVSSRRRGRVSAHELHYTANRAVSEELRRKTFLPYKQGLLGCLGFNPTGVHDISGRSSGSMPRG